MSQAALRASPRASGALSCAYCRTPLAEAEARCRDCGVACHVDCLAELGDWRLRCPSLGCAGWLVDPRAPEPQPEPPRDPRPTRPPRRILLASLLIVSLALTAGILWPLAVGVAFTALIVGAELLRALPACLLCEGRRGLSSPYCRVHRRWFRGRGGLFSRYGRARRGWFGRRGRGL